MVRTRRTMGRTASLWPFSYSKSARCGGAKRPAKVADATREDALIEASEVEIPSEDADFSNALDASHPFPCGLWPST